jgi:hypothetical protein
MGPSVVIRILRIRGKLFTSVVFHDFTEILARFFKSLAPLMDPASTSTSSTTPYAEFLAELEEIRRHKWIASQKAGQDIGFEKALITWATDHRVPWREARRAQRAGG